MVSRRRFLQTSGSVALLGMAGCFSNGEGNGGNGGGGGVDGTVLLSVTDGSDEVDAVSQDHLVSVGSVYEDGSVDGYTLSVGLSDAGIDSLGSAVESVGGYDDPDAVDLRAHHDDEVVSTWGLDSDLAEDLEAGEFSGVFTMEFDSRDTAESLKSDLDSVVE